MPATLSLALLKEPVEFIGKQLMLALERIGLRVAEISSSDSEQKLEF